MKICLCIHMVGIILFVVVPIVLGGIGLVVYRRSFSDMDDSEEEDDGEAGEDIFYINKGDR
jgi:hypothetical protein